MPNIQDLAAAIQTLQKFSAGSNWTASHNDVPIGPVSDIGIGTDGPFFDVRGWVRARFEENGVASELRGEHHLLNNKNEITFTKGGANVAATTQELVLSNRLVGATWRIVLEYVFTDPSGNQRYRFDGTAFDGTNIVKGVILG